MYSKQAPTNSGLKDDLADSCTCMVVRFHCFSIVGLMTTNHKCNVFCLVWNSVSIQIESESLEWKTATVLKISVKFVNKVLILPWSLDQAS